jgi:hypothetical protein
MIFHKQFSSTKAAIFHDISWTFLSTKTVIYNDISWTFSSWKRQPFFMIFHEQFLYTKAAIFNDISWTISFFPGCRGQQDGGGDEWTHVETSGRVVCEGIRNILSPRSESSIKNVWPFTTSGFTPFFQKWSPCRVKICLLCHKILRRNFCSNISMFVHITKVDCKDTVWMHQ